MKMIIPTTKVKPLLIFFVLVLVDLLPLSVSQDIIDPTCDYQNNFTINGTYQRILDSTLSSLTSDTSITYGFYNRSVGSPPEQANVIALCRGDVQPADCRSCINDARTRLRELCPNQKGAVGWYDNCMLRYSNATILGTLDTNGGFFMWNPNNATNVAQFDQVLQGFLGDLRTQASSGGSLRKYASNDTEGPSFVTIYGLMQCTPDLSENQCYDCLDTAMKQIPTCCNGRRGGRVVYPSCNLRYEDYRFFNNTVALSLPPPPSPPPPIEPSPSPPAPSGMYIHIRLCLSSY